MKKFVTIFSCLLFVAMHLISPVSAASITPPVLNEFDSNLVDYTPPDGYIHYEIPDSGTEGTHTVTFDPTGNVDPNGDYSFTVVVGTEPGEDFTKVLSWSSNFPIYAVIVKSGDVFKLVTLDNASGIPADVSDVSIVFNPADLQMYHPVSTSTSAPTRDLLLNDFFSIIFIALLIIFFLLGIILGSIFDPPKRNHRNSEKVDPVELKDKPQEPITPEQEYPENQYPRRGSYPRDPRNNYYNNF